MKLWILLVLTAALTVNSSNDVVSYEEVERLVEGFVYRNLTTEERGRFDQLVELLAFPNYLFRNSIEEYAVPRVTLTCVVCRATMRAAFDLIRDNTSDDEINAVFKELCVVLGAANEKVCNGMVELNIPILSYIIRTNLEARADTFCGLALQSTDESTCPFDDPRFEWSVQIPARGLSPQPPTGYPEPMKILLLTDAHIDPLYEAFGVGNCDEPTCCRYGQNEARGDPFMFTYDDSIIAQSFATEGGDVNLNLSFVAELRRHKEAGMRLATTVRDSEPAGYWGDYRACDTPLWAFDDIIERTRQAHSDVDAIYYIGDTIDHGVWETSYDLINEMNSYLIDSLKRAFPDKPVFVAIGNHESQPMNQFAPSYVTQEGLETNWLYDSLATKMGDWLTEDAAQTFRRDGYYTMLLRPGLRIIVLNPNVAYKYNWWLNYDPQDQKTHLDWFVDVLAAAESANERVHIISHIPPGVQDLTKVWTREYARIVERFNGTIVAEFNGHTHTDEFKVFYTSDNSPSYVAWNCGSMSSYAYLNVNYKLLTVDGNDYTPMDIQTYMYNLTEANLKPYENPHWFMVYDFRSTYNLPSLNADDMHELIFRMARRESSLLDIYSAYLVKLSDLIMGWSCNESCLINRLCRTVVTELFERQRCEELTEIYYSNA